MRTGEWPWKWDPKYMQGRMHGERYREYWWTERFPESSSACKVLD